MAVLNLSIDLRTLKPVLQLPEPTQKLLDVQNCLIKLIKCSFSIFQDNQGL